MRHIAVPGFPARGLLVPGLVPGLLVLLALAAPRAAAQERPEALFLNASQVVVPQHRAFVVRRSRRPAHPVRIERVDVHVKIRERAATTTLEVTLVNPAPRQAEAVLLLPVPDGAAVSAFHFDGVSREPTARLLPKEEARRIYDRIVRRMRDPALLEFAGHALVRSSVFPVPANGRQKVRLTYDHVLPVSNGRVDYVLPRSEALDANVPWNVTVDVRSKAPVATVYSPSHAVKTLRDGDRRLTVKLDGRADPGAFRLSYMVRRGAVTASLFAYPDPKIGGGYFLLLAGVPPRGEEAAKAVRREVTLVLDRSGSMAGEKMDQARAAALQILEGLEDGEAFNIVDYSTTVEMFAPRPVLKSRETLLKARAYLAGLRPIGGTNIHDALVEALRQKPVDGASAGGDMLPLVLFLTDGLPTIGQTSETAIRTAVAKGNPFERRVFTFGVGDDVNAPLLDRVAELTRAVPTYVRPKESVEVKVGDVFSRLYGPVFAGGKLTTLDRDGAVVTTVTHDLIPSTLPDLFDGDQLVVLGKYRGEGPLRFRLQGEFLGESRAFDMSFSLDEATTRHAFVPRLWASRRIAYLVDQIRQAGGDLPPGRVPRVGESIANDPRFKEIYAEILRLSTEFGILSEYTAFLATEGTELQNFRRLSTALREQLDDKAVKSRWGKAAVQRAQDNDRGKKQVAVDKLNRYTRADGETVAILNCQQYNDRAYFKRGKAWIDGAMVAGENAPKTLEPDVVIEFGTPAFEKLLDALVKANRQGVLARRGDLYLRFENKTILVRNDWTEEEKDK